MNYALQKIGMSHLLMKSMGEINGCRTPGPGTGGFPPGCSGVSPGTLPCGCPHGEVHPGRGADPIRTEEVHRSEPSAAEQRA